MVSILWTFWRICTFKAGPDTVPASSFLLALLLAVNAIVSIVVSVAITAAAVYVDPSLLEENPNLSMDQAFTAGAFVNALTQVVVGQASVAGSVWLILNLMNFGNRFQRTLSAIFGVDLVITLISGLLFFVTLFISPLLTSITITALMFWSLTAIGFILHRALQIHIGFGIALSLFIVLFSIALSQAAVS